ncbi:HEAT repeat domain-containing protein [Longispora fulva]|uniref:HEAT repeat protein n=1 Tax=Longispora fulva TaxID=619741 RepID=A0A8J7GFM7_9ACTN|nr:HEAT repeat domain-containing protein [Longispora fulva]MBG6137994.1 HEAT repeat protein [Longispora fulva]
MNIAALAHDPLTPAAELAAAVYSCEDPLELPVILALADHDDPQVRQAVAAQLPLLADPKPEAVIAALLRLTCDPFPDVRDWACFALGTQCPDIDTPELRDALAARLADPDNETRCEALFGLAQRRDPRALPAVARALAHENVWLMEIEAAGALGDPSLHTLVRGHLDGWQAADVPRVCAALRLTDPDGVGEDLVDGLADWFRHGGPSAKDPKPYWWGVALTMLNLAAHRSVDLASAVRDRLIGDESALAALYGSGLAQDAKEHGWT